MVNQIIHPGLDSFWRTEIDPVCFAHLPDLLPCASETKDGGVKFGKIGFQHGRRIASGITGDEEWEETGTG